MQHINDYTIIESTTGNRLSIEVRAMIKSGWIPLGAPVITLVDSSDGEDYDIIYTQAMTHS